MWKNRNVWIICIGELIAGVGLWTSIIGNLEFMQRHVPSDFLKAVILFIGLLAGVLVGPLAGRVIDSSKKKTVLLYSGFGRMVSVCFMFVALQQESLLWMVLFAISLQISAAFYFPALQAIIPLAVEEKQLLTLNGIHMNVATVGRIAGTALAGLMLTVMSLYSLYLASLIAYLFLLISTWYINVDESRKDAGSRHSSSKSKGFREIIPLLRSMPVVTRILLLTIVPTLFIGGFNLMVINISELQHDATIKGLLYTVEGCCFMLGTVLAKRLPGGSMMQRLFALSIFVAISHLLLFFADDKLMSLVAFGLFGLSIGCFFPIISTVFQTQVPKEYHGRFFSFRTMFDRVLFQVILLCTGMLLDLIGLKYMVLVFGLFSLLLVFYFASRPVRQSASSDAALREMSV
ncbi:macrolide transporter [Cohnella kolymensis]|uniref:Macrolide transporter n=1 Tax=Cohnella kolymensis TaxID=1590652 RepID=A0ABR5A3N3_9BACL|nr:MFS transporter [Cohnella kolymensis]KIL35022.1 macrolide transporter [Cohnella kolymensis]